jgi:hypothetical protein
MRTVAMFALVAALFSGYSSSAQESEWPDPVNTSAPANVRFEVLHGGIADVIYRLDKTSGQVWYFDRVPSMSATKFVWRPIPPPAEAEDTPRPAVVNYQLFYSARNDSTVLMNVHSGETWALRRGGGRRQWEPVTPER